MTTPYRNEIDALRERKESLEREAARLREQTSQLDGLRTQQAELEREIAAIAAKLGAQAKRTLPMLDQVKVASPCSANWDDMVGDHRVRFCLSCEKNVYNLSAMPREEAEQLLQQRAGAEMCIRFYRRADGTVMTEDCPVGVKKKRRKKLALAIAGAGAMAASAATFFARQQCAVQGEMMGALPVAVAPDQTATPHVMGSAAAMDQDPTPPTPPEPPPPPPQHIQGRRAR